MTSAVLQGALEAAAVQGASERATELGRPRARVLLVDDDKRNLLAVETVLEGIEADIQTARSGPEALRYLLSGDFAVILLDVNMPGMDGYEVATLIRRRERTRFVPIIFLTAVNTDQTHVFRGYASGAVDYIFKPVHPGVLKNKVSVFVDLYNQRQDIARQLEVEQLLRSQNAQIQAELRRLEGRQANAIKALPLALYELDVTGGAFTHLFLGDNVDRLFGFPAKDFADNSDFWAGRVHPEDRDRVLAQYAEIARPGGPEQYALEYRWRFAEEQYRVVFDQGIVVRDAQGIAREILGSWLDITDRRNAEAQLMQIQKMEAIGQLTGGIAHDFNNMLTVVIAGLDRLRRQVAENPKALRTVEPAFQGALRCADLTRRLLTFARRQPLEPQSVDIAVMVRGMTHLFERALEERISLDIALDDGLWFAHADPTQVESALVNLVVNARDAMPEGGQVSIRAGNATLDGTGEASAGEYVAITVTDTGTGMSSAVLERAFEPFFTTKNPGRGSGLGLSIIYGFVRQLGGDVRIDSELGRGTAVTLFLPRSTVAPLVVPDVADVPDLPCSRGGETVLVVEDDRQVRGMVIQHLAELGYAILEAPDGPSAMALLEDGGKPVDLLFTDIVMPGGMDGYQLARAARVLRPGLKVLFTSGYADKALANNSQFSEVPMLKKPYRDGELATMVRHMLDDLDGRSGASGHVALAS